ncbi:HAD-like protein [Westerdykella ornata]|uniref:HAD-like protein n=1 Tax=Westerdykella ornata TaxID=318751 RepID=A0A6A6JVR1_WESOR|nr:HAD-like protein [Westerdykella ornata]KAF2280477.1 HAD-like protein [Westerdykella ornata]
MRLPQPQASYAPILESKSRRSKKIAVPSLSPSFSSLITSHQQPDSKQPTMAETSKFPPIRACIFDVDGTLINSEDVYTEIYNHILRSYGAPDYPWKVKAIQQSRGHEGTQRLLNWAQIGLTPAEWKALEHSHVQLFRTCELLPGVSSLLSTLSTLKTPYQAVHSSQNSHSSQQRFEPLRLALASSAGKTLFEIKTNHLPIIASTFPQGCRVFGDDEELVGKKTKPEPDLFLLALKRINLSMAAGSPKSSFSSASDVGLGGDIEEDESENAIQPEEVLVFEDSIAGVEAARRAGMRVVWVPHPGLANVARGREMEVLMGVTEKDGAIPAFADEEEGGKPDVETEGGVVMRSPDGWAVMLRSLEEFPYKEFGFDVDEGALTSS